MAPRVLCLFIYEIQPVSSQAIMERLLYEDRFHYAGRSLMLRNVQQAGHNVCQPTLLALLPNCFWELALQFSKRTTIKACMSVRILYFCTAH